MFLEPLVYIVPDQASSDHDGTMSRIVGDLGELSGVNVDSLGRGESGIRCVAAALDLKRHGVGYLSSALDHNTSQCDHSQRTEFLWIQSR